jgi:hypothetical protein
VSHSTDVGCTSEETVVKKLFLTGTIVLLTATSAYAQSRDPMTGQRNIAAYDHNISDDDGGSAGGDGIGGARGGSGGGGGGGNGGRGGARIEIIQPPSCLPNCTPGQLLSQVQGLIRR